MQHDEHVSDWRYFMVFGLWDKHLSDTFPWLPLD
jgi:hypothetical protein